MVSLRHIEWRRLSIHMMRVHIMYISVHIIRCDMYMICTLKSSPHKSSPLIILCTHKSTVMMRVHIMYISVHIIRCGEDLSDALLSENDLKK